MNIQAMKCDGFKLSVGGVDRMFTATSRWNGLTELTDESGKKLVVAYREDIVSSIIGSPFGMRVICGDADLMAELSPSPVL